MFLIMAYLFDSQVVLGVAHVNVDADVLYTDTNVHSAWKICSMTTVSSKLDNVLFW